MTAFTLAMYFAVLAAAGIVTAVGGAEHGRIWVIVGLAMIAAGATGTVVVFCVFGVREQVW